MMVGYGGKPRGGPMYRYYNCKNTKLKTCTKKPIPKKKIEDLVVLWCRKQLEESDINQLAKQISAAYKTDFDTSAAKRLNTALKEAESAIENLWKALEVGKDVGLISERIKKREDEKKELQAQIAIEMNSRFVITEEQLVAFFHSLQRSSFNDETTRKGLINVFLNAVYLYNDRFTLVFNGSNKPIVIDDILLDEIVASDEVAYSTVVAGTPPPPDNPNLLIPMGEGYYTFYLV
jgi:hypothetical protein